MKIKYMLLVLVLTFFSRWCLAEELTVTSNPEQADIFIKTTSNDAGVKIGRTPLKIPMSEVVNNFAKSNVFILEISKEGFDPYRVLLTRTGSNDIELSVNLDVSKNLKLVKDVDYLVTQLFEVQRQIRIKDYVDALKRLDILEKDFPHYSVVYELKASTYYLSKDFSKALSYYRKAFSMNSDNRDAYIMKLYLEEKFKLEPKTGG
ncbi:MAG: hypothetical protein A2X86_05275 [Bdellovibrionales bacterium GWA2_49_15]|nr:MAG: hypothetical protein A2X86_05275 [Bdellovibrionales bacterium GWA2_49_15]